MRFYMPEFNLPKLEKLVNRLKRKTNIQFQVFDNTRRQTSVTIDGERYPYTEIEVELDLNYRVGDYQLVAQLEHTPNGNVIRKINPNAQVPAMYRNTNCYCDHCHTNRDRRNTFLLVDANGDYKQVGKSCLNDFTGYNSESVAEAATSLYRIYDYAQNQNFEEDPEFMQYLRETHSQYSDTKELANRFYQLLRVKGYDKYNPFEDLDDYHYDPRYDQQVDELLNVVNTDWYNDNNDYCHNAKLVTEMQYVTPRHWKILMSYLNSAMDYLQRQQQNNSDSNIYLGNVGDKIEFTIQSVKVLFSGYSEYGESYTYKFITENGNVVLWTTGKNISDDYVGCKVKGTIKALKEYKGEKQTVITRAKIDETGLQDRINQREEERRRQQERQRAEQNRSLFNPSTDEDDGFEDVAVPHITESKLKERKTNPRLRESLLQEGKQDIENFKKWIENNEDSNARYMNQVNKKAFVNSWATEFNSIRQNLKSPYNDFYYWIKLNDWDAFTKFMFEQRNKKDAKQREKDGARLIYSDSNWKVYEITTYEASVKYGANTKWCISGSKRWSNGANGKGYWDDYTSKGVKFYFFIGKNTKYAIAIYPNGTDFEIFDAQDNSIAYIPNAPIIDEIKVDYYSHNEDRLMLNLIKTGQLPHICVLLSNYFPSILIYDKSEFNDFLDSIRENVSEYWYSHEIEDDDYSYISTFRDNYTHLDDALTKDNPYFQYNESKYFINDLYNERIECCKDWVEVWWYIDRYLNDETALINFIKREIKRQGNYEDFDKVGLSKEYLQDVGNLHESLEDFDDRCEYTESYSILSALRDLKNLD